MSESNTNLATPEQAEENVAPVEAPGFGGEETVKQIDAVSDDHPLVQETGVKAMESDVDNGAGEFLADFIYESDEAWPREWLQNEEAANIRWCKMSVALSDEYPDGWLTQPVWVDSETGDTVLRHDDPQDLADYDGDIDHLREIQVPRPIDEVIEAAKNLGYDPTIVWDVYRDERKIITEDNGIGMTAKQFDEHFNTIFGSGSDVDGDTGGQFGVGSESAAIVRGKSGGSTVESRSRLPNDDGSVRSGFRAYSYLGGANPLPGDVPDGFYGTKFEIPVKDDFDLSNLQDWVETYTDKLRVPVLYREHDAGDTPVEEEYEATNFVEDYGNPAVVVERPGEFTVVAGPNVAPSGYNPTYEDTFLVSMPIDRNTSVHINTYWDVIIQIDDEQGRIVHGPNRGKHRRDVDTQHEDVILPEPTGDRDRLQTDSNSKRFFSFIENLVKQEELKQAKEIVEEMINSEHPGIPIMGNQNDWSLFKNLVDYHGGYSVLDSRRSFMKFIQNQEALPDVSDEDANEMFKLLKDIEYCKRSPSRSTKKRYRSEMSIGYFLAEYAGDSEIFMAASTGGNFVHYAKVANHNYDDTEILIVPTSGKYERWSDLFGFKVLKNMPLTQSDDHDYEIPIKIHQDHKRKNQKKSKSEKVSERTLKIRTDGDNSSIDTRPTVDRVKSILNDGGTISGHSKLVVFPRSADENISDHYDLADYAAICSVTAKEYDQLVGTDNLMTYSEFASWSESATILTEDGRMTPEELIEDDRLVILFRATSDGNVLQLLSEKYDQLRNYYTEDIKDQIKWTEELDDYDSGYRGDDESDVDEADKPDTLFALASDETVNRAKWAFDNASDVISHSEMMSVSLSTRYWQNSPCSRLNLNESTHLYRLMADTPEWDDESEIYNVFPNSRDTRKAQMYLAFHDAGVDPTNCDPDEIRDMIDI
jgi:hypothetical protein